MMEISKADWKLFRSRIAEWQEVYMERLIKEYVEILNGEGAASDKFWELEKRIKNDKRIFNRKYAGLFTKRIQFIIF